MQIGKGFYDLCVPHNKNPIEMSQILAELYECGYRTVAIEQTFDHTTEQKKSSDIFPEPVSLDALKLEFYKKLTILNRITIIYTEPIVVHAMNNSNNLKKYQIIAGSPKNDTAMQHCCSTFNGDIITHYLDENTTRITLATNKYYQLAIRRGMFFELKYVPAIVNSNFRKDIMTIAQSYALQRKKTSRNVIISSGALTKFNIRGPYDIANFGNVLGFSEEQAKGAISYLCRTVILRAESRRYGKTVMFVENMKKTNQQYDDSSDDDDDDDNDDNDDDEDDGEDDGEDDDEDANDEDAEDANEIDDSESNHSDNLITKQSKQQQNNKNIPKKIIKKNNDNDDEIIQIRKKARYEL